MFFDATNISPEPDTFEVIPPGWYSATIVSSETHCGSNASSGEMLKLAVEINGNDHPHHAGRRVFAYLCINHESSTPREIAQKALAAICHATGHVELKDPGQLLGEEIKVRLKLRPAKGDYAASNDIAGWQKISTGQRPTTEATPTPHWKR